MGILGKLFGNKTKKIMEMADRGAIVIDVRSPAEYGQGAIPGSKNIPLPQIAAKADTIKSWDKPIITCCASGMRSGSAAAILRSKGIEVINGGGWYALNNKIR